MGALIANEEGVKALANQHSKDKGGRKKIATHCGERCEFGTCVSKWLGSCLGVNMNSSVYIEWGSFGSFS